MNKQFIDIKDDINIDIIADLKGINFKKFHFKNDNAEMVRAYFYSNNLPKGTVIQITSNNSKESYFYNEKKIGYWSSITLFGNGINISVYLPKLKLESKIELKFLSIDYTCKMNNIDNKNIIEEDGRRRIICYKETNNDIFQHSLTTMQVRTDRYATASSIGSGNHFLTNYHVIPSSAHMANSEFWFNYYSNVCSDHPIITSILQPLKLQGDNIYITGGDAEGPVDYTLFYLDEFDFKYSNVKRLFGGLEMQNVNPKVGENIYIPQYGDNGLLRDAYVSVKTEIYPNAPDCSITKINDRIYYNADTIIGSSGSPVISRVSHKLVGLHNQSVDDMENRGITPAILWQALSPFIEDTNNAVQGVPYPININYVLSSIDSPQVQRGVINEYIGNCYFELANNDAKIEHYDNYSLVYIVKKLNDSVIVENTPPLKLWVSNQLGNFPINNINVFGDTITLNYEIDNSTLVAEEIDFYRSWLLLKRINLFDLSIISEEVIYLSESTMNPKLKLS